MNQKQNKNDSKRIVVTGIGAVTPYGLGCDIFFKNLSMGKSGISFVDKMNTSELETQKGGEIKWYNANEFFTKYQQKHMDINSQYLILSTREAIRTSNLSEDCSDKNISVCIGTLTAGLPFTEKYYMDAQNDKYSPILVSQSYRSSATHNMASYFNIYGPRYTITTACSASMHTIGLGAEYIRNGMSDMSIVGGVDAFCGVTWGGFNSFKSMSSDEIRPFDKNRKGLLIGEGSGVMVLESLSSAKRRGVHIYGEIKGWGSSGDAYHITAPNMEGASAAMEAALINAGMDKNDIDYIGAHGTATHLNDVMETNAIKKVFGNRAGLIPISSIKSMIGHTMGASGIHLALATLGMIQEGRVYPTINYETADEECNLDYVPNVSREHIIKNAMLDAFGFGGNNAVLVVSAYSA